MATAAAAASTRKQVLTAYRSLIKTSRHVFQGDVKMLALSQNQIKVEFRKNANVNNEVEVKLLCLQAQEAAEYMRQTIVQAVKEDGHDEYDVKLGKDQVSSILDSTATLSPIDEKSIAREEKRGKTSSSEGMSACQAEDVSTCCGGGCREGKRE